MSLTVIIAALLGAGTGLGLVLASTALAARHEPLQNRTRPAARWRWPWRRAEGSRDRRRVAVCVAVGLVAAVVTRWPVAALLAAAGAWVLPDLVGPDRAHARRVARIEAIATWTESLRDTLSAAAGLEQAIAATAAAAPAPIRAEVARLAERIGAQMRLPVALRAFAVDVNDATADLVAAALVAAAERHARHIGDLLSALATAARDQASLRMRVAAGRARVRTSIRVVTGVTLTMAVGLVLLNRGYLAPYDTPTGQLVLAAVGGLFGAGFWWLSRIAAHREPARVLALAATTAGEAQP